MKIFDYIDYRAFLRDYYEEKKKANTLFSYRTFSRMADLGGKNYLQEVSSGRRNLSASSIRKFSKALKFTKKEAEYFESLVFYNQAKNEEERDIYFNRLMHLRPNAKAKSLTKDEINYLSQHYYVVIREMVSLPDFIEDYKWISSQIRPHISPKDAQAAVEALLRLKLIERDKGGKLVNTDNYLKTSSDDFSWQIYHYLRTSIGIAKDAVLEVDQELRDINSMTFPISIKQLDEVKEILEESRKKISAIIQKESRDYFDVYQLNMQFFPLTRINQKVKPRVK